MYEVQQQWSNFKHHVIYNQINLSSVTINDYFHLICTIPIAIALQISQSVADIWIVLFNISQSDKHPNIYWTTVTFSRKIVTGGDCYPSLNVIKSMHYILGNYLAYVCWNTVYSWVAWSHENSNETYKGSAYVWQYTVF